MFELQESGSAPSTVGRFARVLPRVGVSVLFIVIGYTKFNDDSPFGIAPLMLLFVIAVVWVTSE